MPGTHKLIGFSPVLMAACIFFLVAASVGLKRVTGLSVWC